MSYILKLINVLQIDLPRDIVINASPTHPPLSLLGLKTLMKINVVYFIHSSVPSLDATLREFSEKLKSSNTPNPLINVSLIWKNGE